MLLASEEASVIQTPYVRALSRLSRRELLNIAWKIGAAAVALPRFETRTYAQMAFAEYPFTMGVASGDPLPDGIVLWTRLAPKPTDGGGVPMANIEVGWELARERAFTTIVQRGTAIARPELGHSVHVDVQGLEPARDYFYRFRCGREVSDIGRTRTAPAAGVAIERLRFAVCGCSHYETGYFTAFRRIAEEQFDFVFHTGDYIYEGRADGGQNTTRVRQHAGQEIYTLVDYRNRYGQYKSDPDLRAAHASAPFVMTWDDHEVSNDYAGDHDEDDTPPEIFLLRRAAAYQAYYEAMPLRARSSARARSAAVPSAEVRHADRSQHPRHAPVPVGSGVRRRHVGRLPGGGRHEPDDRRRGAGGVAVQEPCGGAEHVDRHRPAGAVVRA
jgi:alkaline phosphatase D